MMFIIKIFPKFIPIILVFIFINSCKSSIEQYNNDFLSDYGSDVSKIKSKRSGLLNKKIVENEKPKEFGWRSSGDIIGVSGPIQSSSAFVDTSDIKLPEAPEEFSPDLQTLERAKVDPNLPQNMFKVSYNTKNYPDSYRKTEVSFDDIRIPGYDAFGIETDLGKKEYLLVDKEVLQDNIDYLNSSITKDDREISLILINEQKDIKQKRILGILGEGEEIDEEEYIKKGEEALEELEDLPDENEKESSEKDVNQDNIKKVRKKSSGGGIVKKILQLN